MKRWIVNNRGLLIFLLCFGIFRTSMADWNPIPSGSMRPTLLEGDVVLVNRLAYDLKLPLSDISLAALGNPQRGDVVTFTSPKDGVRLIKRLVGVPGDVLEMRNEVLFVNGVAAHYSDARDIAEPGAHAVNIPGVSVTEVSDHSERRVQFLRGVAAARDFGPITVPADSYFMLGDNRDNSADSRYIGFVPRRLLIGRAHHIVVSADILGHWMPRLDRTGKRIL
ncbi:signal peptidase I [Pseudomonas fuscovaginae UPB0736]|uniref:Signal peptidase I n=1 Tax=Pseudomonas asplenii TaxID=53407 RepID=A0A1H1WRA0_9PSED|nr:MULTISPECIES: signal peptidase I [Pseudomonas]UUQ64149.1 signal peptidase I [Pseudomonas fuscovaginae UPB0736]UZE27355.1 signal peptidase I [Pseudomonas asplenii]SDS99171.1 signal peptidase I Serine peptidase. MEROPS family S26A [Pseudomonas asplenii]SEI23013.1 signal peptidase I Serine peptidase. MEROPS family S26A [Pseudomonas fuscovaginae]